MFTKQQRKTSLDSLFYFLECELRKKSFKVSFFSSKMLACEQLNLKQLLRICFIHYLLLQPATLPDSCKIYTKSWSRNCPNVMYICDILRLFPWSIGLIFNITSETSWAEGTLLKGKIPFEFSREGWPSGISIPSGESKYLASKSKELIFLTF